MVQFDTIEKSPTTPTTPVHGSPRHLQKRRGDLLLAHLPSWEVSPHKKQPVIEHARIAKGRPPAPLGTPVTLRRTKSLPLHLDGSHRFTSQQESTKSLFWFRPHPNRPLLSAKQNTNESLVLPPYRGSNSLRQSPPAGAANSFASKSLSPKRRMLRVWRHRRVATSPDPMNFLPRELDLPTLKEEEQPRLRPGFLQRDDSYNGDMSSADFDLTNDDDSDDDDQEDELLRGLSLLEERDE